MRLFPKKAVLRQTAFRAHLQDDASAVQSHEASDAVRPVLHPWHKTGPQGWDGRGTTYGPATDDCARFAETGEHAWHDLRSVEPSSR